MGGSGGGSGSYNSGGDRRAESAAVGNAAGPAYDAETNSLLQGLLGTYNDRNVDVIQRRLDTLCKAVERDIEGSVGTVFGGSVKKHTYVDGISDIDVLMIVNDTSLSGMSPQNTLAYLEKRLRERLLDTAVVTAGRLAVSVKYRDGIELQILPAIRRKDGVRIASSDGAGWTPVVRPDSFAKKLTEVNRACNGKVVPVIKLFKGLQDASPQNNQLKGYHVESLAIEAFRSYTGRQAFKDMLSHFVRSAADRVLRPLAETTGQSRHVDDHLGEANSADRQRISKALGRISEQMDAADRTSSVDQFRRLFGG